MNEPTTVCEGSLVGLRDGGDGKREKFWVLTVRLVILKQLSMRITFDNNCLIDLENQEGDYKALRQLVQWHDEGKITVCVSAIQASERTKQDMYTSNFSVFRKRVQALSKVTFDILLPPCYLDICYLGHCILGSDEDEKEKEIHAAMFPKGVKS